MRGTPLPNHWANRRPQGGHSGGQRSSCPSCQRNSCPSPLLPTRLWKSTSTRRSARTTECGSRHMAQLIRCSSRIRPSHQPSRRAFRHYNPSSSGGLRNFQSAGSWKSMSGIRRWASQTSNSRCPAQSKRNPRNHHIKTQGDIHPIQCLARRSQTSTRTYRSRSRSSVVCYAELSNRGLTRSSAVPKG